MYVLKVHLLHLVLTGRIGSHTRIPLFTLRTANSCEYGQSLFRNTVHLLGILEPLSWRPIGLSSAQKLVLLMSAFVLIFKGTQIGMVRSRSTRGKLVKCKCDKCDVTYHTFYLLLPGLLIKTPSHPLPSINASRRSLKVARDPSLALIPGLALIRPAPTIAAVALRIDVRHTGAGHAHHILPDMLAGKHQDRQIKRDTNSVLLITVSLTLV